MTDIEIDPAIIAMQELADGMVPAPEDFVTTLQPISALYYLWQVASQVVPVWAASMQELANEGVTDGAEVEQAFEALMSACGLLTGACQAVSLLPPDEVTDEVTL